MKDEALKLALEALETELAVDMNNGAEVGEAAELMCEAITAIKQALAAPVQEPVAYRQTGWAAHRDQYAVPVLFNPYTGQPRDVRDVQSDPQGILIVPPGKIEMLAAKPTHQQGLQVDAPPAAQPAVPDAFGTREGEHPQYIQGWNDCRAEMQKGKP